MKPGTYTQMFVHIVIAVKCREYLLTKDIRPEIFKYIAGIVKQRKHKLYIVNGYLDHVHILLGLNSDDKISDLVGSIKRNSADYIKEKQLIKGKFQWQEGYGAFSYSKSQMEQVYNYISEQEEHHRKKTFKEEYINMLKKYEISFEEKYLFEFYE